MRSSRGSIRPALFPWGQDTGTTGAKAATNPWTYAGGYDDTTCNRIKFGARYYNPARGRFTQPDPSGQETDRYLYAAANPTNGPHWAARWRTGRNILPFRMYFSWVGSR